MSDKPVRPHDNSFSEQDLTRRLEKDEFLQLAKFAMDRAADSIVWVDQEGRLVYANDAACSSLGYTREELLRMKVFDIDPDFPADQFEEHVAYMRKHGIMRFESRHRAKDGRIFPVEVSTNYYDYKGEYLGIAFDRDISARKEAEAALKASEEKYKAMFNNSPIGIVQNTFGGDVIDTNPAMVRMFGYEDKEEMLEAMNYRAEAVYADPSQRKMVVTDLLKSPGGISREVKFIRKGGSTFSGILHASLQFDDEGEPTFVNGTIEDVTERKQAVEELRQREALLAEVGRIAKIGGWEHDLIEQKAIWSPETYRIVDIPPDQEPPGPNEYLEYFHPEDRPVLKEAMERAVNHGESFDLELRCFTEKGRFFWSRTIGYPVFENDRCVRVYGAFQDITERMRAEEELRKREALLAEVGRLAKIGGWELDLIAGKGTWSREFYRIMEIPPDQETPSFEEFQAYVHPEDRPRVQEVMERAINHGESFEQEGRSYTATGRLIWTRSIGRPVFENGKCVRVSGTFQDITEQKQAEEAMRLSEEKYRTIFNNTPVGVFRNTFDGRVEDVNPAMVRIFGHTDKEELLSAINHRAANVYANPADRDSYLKDLMKSPEGLFRELEFKRPDGTTFPGVLFTSIQFDADGKPIYTDGTIQDITEQKQAVEELRQREAQLAEVSRLAKIGGWERDLIEQKATWSLEFYRIMEISPDQEPPRFEEFLTYIHPDDRSLLQKAMERAVSHGESFDLELCCYTEKGRLFWSRAIGYPVFEEGKCVRVFGAFQDITERRQAEEALRMSEEKFSTLFRLSPDSVMLIDLETKVLVDVNDAFVGRSGYSREEMIGKTSTELGFYLDDTVRDRLYEQLATTGHVEGLEAEFLDKAGGRGTYSMSATYVTLGGRPHVLAIAHNVTEMKRMQEMMVQTEKMLSVGGIAAGVAHEINNPLGIILQAAQNLQQRCRPDFPKNKEVADTVGLNLNLMAEYMLARKLDVFIEDICNAALRASAIIRHLLNFSRRSESRRAICNITAIVDGAIALANSDFDLRKSYDFRKIDVHVSVDDHLPQINCTDTEIEQVLLNLLRNAAQAMSTAEPPITEPRIDIRVQGRDEWVRIEVEDNGPGMSKEMQQRIFEPFFTTKAPGVGTGLGLSVSYFIITTGHSGRFTVASEPGQGALFTIDLPTEAMRETL